MVSFSLVLAVVLAFWSCDGDNIRPEPVEVTEETLGDEMDFAPSDTTNNGTIAPQENTSGMTENDEITIYGKTYVNIKNTDYQSLPNYKTIYVSSQPTTPNIDNMFANGDEFVVFAGDVTIFDALNRTEIEFPERYCKIHLDGYHSFPDSDQNELTDIPSEQILKFAKKYFKASIYSIECMFDYNIFKLMFEFEIPKELILKELLSQRMPEERLEGLKADEIDMDALNLAWKNPYAVYKKGGTYYTLDWIATNTAETYQKHQLPLDQLREIVSKLQVLVENDPWESYSYREGDYAHLKREVEDYAILLGAQGPD